jgi:SecD/SecF fusion protein
VTSRRRNIFVLLLVVGLTIASIVVILDRETRLGLDLRGGIELTYQGEPTPQNPDVTTEDLDRAIDIMRDRVDTLGVSEPEISTVGETQISVGLPDIQDVQEAVDQIGTTAQLYFYDWQPNVVSNPDSRGDPGEAGFPRLIDAVRFAAKQDEECFEDACTTRGSTYYLFDRDTLELLSGPAQSENDLFTRFDDNQPPNSEVIEVPQGTIVVEEPPFDNPETEENEAETNPTEYFVLQDRPALSGDEIENPEQQFDPQTNQPNVTFDFTDEGREAFAEVTREIALRGRQQAPIQVNTAAQADQFSDNFAIVLDQEVVSRPIINFIENPSGIDGRTGAQISGLDNLDEAQNLAEFLRIGALPIELQLISQTTVSATLGEEALDEGLKAGLIGLAIVLLFLIAYYRLLGVIAGLGLLVYAAFFYALIELIPITLTLPGIAGLILTIGVAADSNIVIFERIKEEYRAGRSMPSAIAQGYKKGIATIIDANVITLMTAFILFVLATAGVKGFAFTLGVGTIVSLFTAVVFTQAILGTFGRARFLRSPALLGASEEQRVRWHFDFTGASRWFFSFSGAILAIGALSLAINQLNLGIDFESGTKIRASLEEPATVDEVRSVLVDAGVGDASTAEIQEVDDPEFGDNVVQIQTEELQPDGVGEVQQLLIDEFGLVGGEDGFDGTSVGPSFGQQVAESAVLAILFSLLVISAYVAIRFEAKYAIPVLIALVHDILITAGVYSLVGAEVTSATVAAFLTILGYSMYDTIIVFDRIRENVPRMPRAAFSQIVNRSMSEIFTRSLITGLSTVFLLTVLLIFGGDTLTDFAFAMMVGIASGFYSSIFIASPVLTAWKEREPQYRNRREVLTEAMGYVPPFPEENVVERVEEGRFEGDRPEGEEPAVVEEEPKPREPEPEVASPAAAGDGAPGDGAPEQPAADELVGAGSEQRQPKPERRQQQKRRQQRRRRKHGRHR